MGAAVDAGEQYDDAFNGHDAETRKTFLNDSSELVLPGGMRFQGPDQVMQVAQGFWAAFPDGQIIRERHITNGGEAATEGRVVGTHTGPFPTPQGEIPATGNRVEFEYVSLRRVESDKIVSEHLYFDQMGFLQQLGGPAAPLGLRTGEFGSDLTRIAQALGPSVVRQPAGGLVSDLGMS
jgi:predicted ester cyclase